MKKHLPLIALAFSMIIPAGSALADRDRERDYWRHHEWEGHDRGRHHRYGWFRNGHGETTPETDTVSEPVDVVDEPAPPETAASDLTD